MSNELCRVMNEVFPAAQFTRLVDRMEIVCVRDMMKLYEKANDGGDVHQTHKILGGVLSTMTMKNCSTDPMTPEVLGKLGVSNELVGLARMSIDSLKQLDENHKQYPKNKNYSVC